MAAEQKQQHDEDKNDWLGHVVRLGLMIWAIGVITANYMGCLLYTSPSPRD